MIPQGALDQLLFLYICMYYVCMSVYTSIYIYIYIHIIIFIYTHIDIFDYVRGHFYTHTGVSLLVNLQTLFPKLNFDHQNPQRGNLWRSTCLVSGFGREHNLHM